MEYWLSDIPSISVMELINKYRYQIEDNLSKTCVPAYCSNDACIRWAVIFAKFGVNGDVRTGIFSHNGVEIKKAWMMLYDSVDIIFDPCAGDFSAVALPNKYITDRIYSFEDLGSGDEERDFLIAHTGMVQDA